MGFLVPLNEGHLPVPQVSVAHSAVLWGSPRGPRCWGRVSLALPGYKAGTPPWTGNRTTASSSTFPDVKPYVKICRRSKIQLHLITQRGAASDLTWDDSGRSRCLAGCGGYCQPAGRPGLASHGMSQCCHLH